MMNLVWIIKFSLIIIFIAHNLSILLYLLPNNYLKKDIGPSIHNYVDSFFYQNWHLFSPNPGLNYKRIWVQCANNKETTNWLDPFESLQNIHEKYRLLYQGKLLYFYRDILENISVSNKDGHIIFENKNYSSKFYFFLSRTCDPQVYDKVLLREANIYPFPFSKTDEMALKAFYKIKVSKIAEINL